MLVVSRSCAHPNTCPMSVISTEFILYVADQAASRDFYAALLGIDPHLDVPGMTEFRLGPACTLGLMPENGIARIITPTLPHPREGRGLPRCELYLLVEDAVSLDLRAAQAGATLVDERSARDWGHSVSYWADHDGHVLAFAEG